MLAAEASLLNIDLIILDVGHDAPAKQVLGNVEHIDGSFTDPAKIRELASRVDILTVEIEHVNVDVLDEIQASSKITIHPSPSTIRTIQDKYLQKQHLRAHGCPLSHYIEVPPTKAGVEGAIAALSLPLMLKSRTLAYDGRGNFVLKGPSQVDEALTFLANRPLYAEKWVPFVQEIAVMVVRSASGQVQSYPAVETVHKDNICHLVFAPLRVADPAVASRAREVAEKAVATLSGAGVFGVEMFLMGDGEIFINEIAPRPHNSGHYTIEACHSSQYANHLRSLLDLPLGSTEMKVSSAAMLNLLGYSNSMDEVRKVAYRALEVPGATTHLYGKATSRKGRKLGHITIVANSDAELRDRLRPLLQALPDATTQSVKRFCSSPPAAGGHSHRHPLVGIIMGSDSDLPVMLPAAQFLERFNIPFELSIVSAHRTPDRMVTYARQAASRGLRCIIAGAGGAAHLPGMVATMTPLPVIGVPVKGSSLDGVDSLHSIVQMPRGIPVATVAINNSTNAGLLAVRILAAADRHLLVKMDEYLGSLEKEVMGKVEKLEAVGWENYVIKR